MFFMGLRQVAGGVSYFCRMKLFITIALLLGTATTVCAQFNTVSRNRTLYKVEIVGKGSDSVPERCGRSHDGNGEAVKKGENEGNGVNEAEKECPNEQDEWIRRYMSVSYPLADITVSSRFGMRADPFTGRKSRHSGLDLKANFEDVYSMMEGIVIRMSSDKQAGRYVTVKYGDYAVSYCHLSQPLVKVGHKVMPGEVIAVSGNTGRSTGPHLHLTVKYGRKHIDPDILLQFVSETRKEALAHIICLSNS